VADYREWRRAAMRELAAKGRIAPTLERELAQIEAAVQSSLAPAAPNMGKFKAKIGAKLAAMGPELSAELGYEKRNAELADRLTSRLYC
jgi:hypothetical protein